MQPHADDPVLCYIDPRNPAFAYFTTQALEKQWADDWNDAPYEYNAGLPYEWWEGRGEPWEIVKVAFESDLVTPRDGALNSRWSVEQINLGEVPWLMGGYQDRHKQIIAGTPLSQFCALIWAWGGTVYLPLTHNHPVWRAWKKVGEMMTDYLTETFAIDIPPNQSLPHGGSSQQADLMYAILRQIDHLTASFPPE